MSSGKFGREKARKKRMPNGICVCVQCQRNLFSSFRLQFIYNIFYAAKRPSGMHGNELHTNTHLYINDSRFSHPSHQLQMQSYDCSVDKIMRSLPRLRQLNNQTTDNETHNAKDFEIISMAIFNKLAYGIVCSG